MNIKELIGKRALFSFKEQFRAANIQEFTIKEVSPSGNWVKLMSLHGTKIWKPVVDISLVEVLQDLNGGEPCPS